MGQKSVNSENLKKNEGFRKLRAQIEKISPQKEKHWSADSRETEEMEFLHDFVDLILGTARDTKNKNCGRKKGDLSSFASRDQRSALWDQVRDIRDVS